MGETKESLYIITGVGYIDRASPRRDEDGIAYPDFFWKAICHPTSGQSAGFWGENAKVHNLRRFVTVAEIERDIAKLGAIFPRDVCQTHRVDESFWQFEALPRRRPSALPVPARRLPGVMP